MKIILTYLFIFFITTNLYSGTPSPAASGEISGKIIDKESGKPLEFATVSLYTNDSSLVNGTITGADGFFSFSPGLGKYYLEIQFIAYESKVINDLVITREKRIHELGNIMIQPSVTNLSEVTVRGERSEMVIGLDRKIFNVGKDLTNAGKSAQDILDNIPSVAVDVDGNISLRGSENVKVLIDGKPSGLVNSGNTDALRSLQGNMIEKVEVVTNPSVKYEAEGMAGIINIVLKKEKREGVNGSFEGTIGNPDYYTLGANVNFRQEKINYFFNYGVNYRQRPGGGSTYQKFFFEDTTYYTRTERDRVRGGWSHNLRGGADFFINDFNTITASFLIGLEDSENTTQLTYSDYDAMESLASITSREDIEQEDERNIEFSINYDKTFEKNGKRKLTALFQYMEEKETELSDITQYDIPINGEAIFNDPILQRSDNGENETNMLIQGDYTHPFSGDGKFEAGTRAELRRIHNPYLVEEQNDAGTWETLPGFSNTFDYDENIYAVYALAGNTFNNFSVQAGLRAELSDIKTHLLNTGERDDKHYIDIFPSIHTTYKLGEVHSMQANYSRRIHRPHFWLLNPFYNYSDARNFFTGNPDLDPEYTDSYELGYLLNRQNTSLYSGVYYRHTTGEIERISFVDSAGITYIRPRNLSKEHSFGVESNASLKLFEWWDMNGSINFYRVITNGTFNGQNLESDTYSWDSRLNSSFHLPWDIESQFIFFYRGRRETTQGTRDPFYMLNFALSKDLLNNTATLTFNVRDALNSRVFRFSASGENFYRDLDFRWSTRRVSLSFIYRLNQKKKFGERRGDGNNLEEGEMNF